MAKYSDIKGFTVQTLSTDTIASQIAGGSWASGGAMNTGRAAYGAAGTLTSALAATGQSSGGNNGTANVEQYDGSSWTETSNVNSARRAVAGSGPSYTNALIFGGLGPLPSGSPTSTLKTAITESWNGSTWTEVGDLTTAVYYGGPACQGTNTATLCFGGSTPSGTANNQSWNGSSWTEVNNLNTARSYIFGIGTSTAALAAGGFTTTTVAINELWDGTSWTETTDLNAANYQGGSSGTSTASLVFGGGGGPGQAATTEAWDGSSWTEVGDISEGNETIRGNGSGSSAAWAAGGSNPPFTTETQEWTAPAVFNQQVEGQLFFNSTTNTFKETITDIPGATWASAPSMNTPAPANYARAQFGGGTSSNVAAGSNPNGNLCESFNGTSWSEFTEKSGGNTEKPGLGHSGTAGFVIGQNSNTAYVEEWNGSSWSEKADLNTGRNAMSAGGTVTSGLVFAGETTEYDETESWNGSAWTEVADLNTGRAKGAGWGASNSDAICAVGFDPGSSPTYRKNTELWDGTSWTETADTNDFHQSGGCSGFISTLGIVFGGDAQQPPGASRTTKTEFWNGTSWTEINDTSVAAMDSGFGPSGKASSAMFITGDTSSGRVNSTEMFDASLANKTITSS